MTFFNCHSHFLCFAISFAWSKFDATSCFVIKFQQRYPAFDLTANRYSLKYSMAHVLSSYIVFSGLVVCHKKDYIDYMPYKNTIIVFSRLLFVKCPVLHFNPHVAMVLWKKLRNKSGIRYRKENLTSFINFKQGVAHCSLTVLFSSLMCFVNQLQCRHG